ncbi:CehA/McbA family metallohydrolase [Alistipes putredinis]|uniref:CehA/McbA family metallohydrolase n=1 Tax=Alistipes putredinis TaxID=28117 RepID=UPI003993CF58
MTNTRIRISALLLAISGLLTPHAAAFGAGKAPKTHELTFSGKATPEQYYVPVYTSFTVPEGIVKISVTQHLGSGEARPGNLDLGIFDERGAGFEGPGFRGWSGGARRSFEIGETEATPGYLAGRINRGRWTVIQMPTTAGRTTDWTLKITLTEGPRAKKLPAPSYAAPQLNDKPGWYRIAPHVHTVHSDGRLTPAEVIALGKASGLDGIVSTDHNTTSALLHWGEVQDPEFLVINGMEVTYGQGHWNIFGLDPHAWIDFRIHHNDTLRYRKAVAKARKAGRLLVANHPYNLDFLYDVTPMDGIEVWNSHGVPPTNGP